MLSFYRMWERSGEQPQSPVWRKMLDLLCQDQHHPGPHDLLHIPSPPAILRPRVLPGLRPGDGELPAAAGPAAGPAADNLQAGPPHEPHQVWALVNTEEEECFVCWYCFPLATSHCVRVADVKNRKMKSKVTPSRFPRSHSSSQLDPCLVFTKCRQ